MKISIYVALALLASPAAAQVTSFGPIVGTGLDINTGRGRLIFSGNELTVASLGADPPKVRLASPDGIFGCVSFNRSHPSDPMDQREHVLICAKPAEDGLGGGQLEVSVKQRSGTGDAAMRKAGVISTAYSGDGQPVVRWLPYLGPFTEGAPPPPPAPAPVPPPPVVPPPSKSCATTVAQGDFLGLQQCYGFASGDEAAYVAGRATWESVIAQMELRAEPQP